MFAKCPLTLADVYLILNWPTSYKDLGGNQKPQVSPQWNIFKNIFRSGQVGEFYSRSVRVGVFFTGV